MQARKSAPTLPQLPKEQFIAVGQLPRRTDVIVVSDDDSRLTHHMIEQGFTKWVLGRHSGQESGYVFRSYCGFTSGCGYSGPKARDQAADVLTRAQQWLMEGKAKPIRIPTP